MGGEGRRGKGEGREGRRKTKSGYAYVSAHRRTDDRQTKYIRQFHFSFCSLGGYNHAASDGVNVHCLCTLDEHMYVGRCHT